MSYSRLTFDAAGASWSGAATYTRPDYDAADASFVQLDGYQILSDGPLGATNLVVSIAREVRILSDGPLGSSSLVVSVARSLRVLSDGPLGSADLVVELANSFKILSDGPLGTTTLVLENVSTNHSQILSDGPLGSTTLLIAKRPLLELQTLSDGPLGASSLTLLVRDPIQIQTLSDGPLGNETLLRLAFPLETRTLLNGPLSGSQSYPLIAVRDPLEAYLLASGPLGSTKLQIAVRDPLEARILASGPLGSTKLQIADLSFAPFSSPYQMTVANSDGSNPITIGMCLYGTSLGIIDYSRKERDTFGAITIIERGYTNRIKYNAEIRTIDADLVRSLLASKRATLAQYVGHSSETSTIVVGYLTQFSIKIEDFMTSKLELEVEGQVITT